MIISAADMRPGQTGTVVDLAGGHGMVRRMQAMGIRPGVPISKLTSQPFRGPVSLQVGATQVAVGFGIARRIIVEVAG